MWRLYVILLVLNMIVIVLLALRIHQLEQERFEMINEFIKELNKYRKRGNKNVK